MALDLIFKIGQITTSVAGVLGSAYIWISSKPLDGIAFLFVVFLFITGLMYLEDDFDEKRARRYKNYRY